MENIRTRFFEGLKSRPVIAGLRDSAQVEAAIRHGVGVLFILGEDIFALQNSVTKAHAERRLIFAHMDLIKGVGRDEAGVRFLAKHVGVDGILTTRSNLISPAKREGLIAVQRLFVLDSESMAAGLPTVEKAAPDAVEVLPGVILPTIAQELAARGALPPLIAGGLIRTATQVEAVLAAGAVAVSTSQVSLWGYRRGGAPPSGRGRKTG
ncbi:MAG: glycerol-3-phosphate responsive antiterminator [Candidatus Methylomirabilota bacterium]|jgi:glycerol uptake operon antiterminator